MTYRLQFSISAGSFVEQKKHMNKIQQKKVLEYLKNLGELIMSINRKKRRLIRLFSGEQNPYYIPLKMKCIKQKLRFHKSLPFTSGERGKKKINPDALRDPQISMIFEYTRFNASIEEKLLREYMKTFNSDPDCMIKLSNKKDSLESMYFSKLIRSIHNTFNTLQCDWDVFCKENKIKNLKLEMFNITYL